MLATGVADVILEERPKLARLRHADRIEQCPLSGVTRKTFAHISSSQFDPLAKLSGTACINQVLIVTVRSSLI